MNISTKLAVGIFSILGSLAIAAPSWAIAFVPNLSDPAWQTSGDVVKTATSAALTNAQPDGFDDPTNLNISTSSPTDAAGLFQAFVGVTNTAFDIGGLAQEGSAVKQVFDSNAGDSFSFRINIPFIDTVGPDFAFVRFNGVNTFYNAVSSNVTFNSGTLASGSNTLVFGVVDISDGANSTRLNTDNFVYQAVPFEFSHELMVGIFGIAAFGLRKKFSPNSKKDK